jgi:hypothetical protein
MILEANPESKQRSVASMVAIHFLVLEKFLGFSIEEDDVRGVRGASEQPMTYEDLLRRM